MSKLITNGINMSKHPSYTFFQALPMPNFMSQSIIQLILAC